MDIAKAMKVLKMVIKIITILPVIVKGLNVIIAEVKAEFNELDGQV